MIDYRIDYWNDPPDEAEPPECCDEIMAVSDDGACSCEKCGNVILPPEEPEGEPREPRDLEDFYEPFPEKETCPHNNKLGECAACDHASDIAFDVAREQRFFHR